MSVRSYVAKSNFIRNFMHVLPVAMARISSDDNTVRYVLPVLCMTSCLHITDEAKATLIGRLVKVIHPGAEPGVKCNVCDSLFTAATPGVTVEVTIVCV